jgi:hypothetical protein
MGRDLKFIPQDAAPKVIQESGMVLERFLLLIHLNQQVGS